MSLGRNLRSKRSDSKGCVGDGFNAPIGHPSPAKTSRQPKEGKASARTSKGQDQSSSLNCPKPQHSAHLLGTHLHHRAIHVSTALWADRMRRNDVAALGASGQLLGSLVMVRTSLVASGIGVTPLGNRHGNSPRTPRTDVNAKLVVMKNWEAQSQETT